MKQNIFLKLRQHPQTLVILGTIGFLVITLPLLRASRYQEKILPNVYAGPLEMSTKSIEEGHDMLKKHAEIWLNKQITLSISGETYSTNFRELGFSINVEETLKQLYRANRGANPYTSMRYYFQTSRNEMVLNIDSSQTQMFIDSKVKPNLASPTSAQFTLQGGLLFLEDDVNGEEVSPLAISRAITHAVNTQSPPSTFEIPVSIKSPQLTTEEMERIKPQVASRISTEFSLKLDKKVWTIPPTTVLSWMIFTDNGSTTTIDISQETIKEYLTTLNKEVARPAKSAKLRYDTEAQRVAIITPGQTGIQLNLEESTQRMRDAIIEGINSVVLAASITEPEIYEGNLESLGIETRIGMGTSNFAGSSPSRIHNVRTAAAKMNGILLAPGEEFSFVENLGQVNAATGYKPELVIKGNRTIPEYGGGVCQVSTTIFRAALYTGLEITERHAHSYVVSYYGTPGLDATIYLPKPDFRFKNTTSSHILLQYYINGTELVFEVYGAPSTRQVNVSEPITLSAGSDGSRRTVVNREVIENGVVLSKDTFYSNYRAPNNVSTNPFN